MVYVVLTVYMASLPSVPVATPLVQSWEALSNYEGYSVANIRAGLQASLRMCIAHTSQVFLVERDSENQLRCQVGRVPGYACVYEACVFGARY